jgi:hypothetical protein
MPKRQNIIDEGKAFDSKTLSQKISEINMKKCPKCSKAYDDSWGVCLQCNVKLEKKTHHIKSLSSVVPMRAFIDGFNKLFIPANEFYADWKDSEDRLLKMMNDIFLWLNLSIANVFGGYDCDLGDVPGVYIKEGNKSSIFVNSKYHSNPFQAAAILAHECMHHFMYVHNLALDNRLENERKTDLLTISHGLGILYVNGMYYDDNAMMTALGLLGGVLISAEEKTSFGYYDAKEYCQHFATYLKENSIKGKDVLGFIHPAARHFLPYNLKTEKKVTGIEIIRNLDKKYAIYGTIKIIVVIVCVGVFLFGIMLRLLGS